MHYSPGGDAGSLLEVKNVAIRFGDNREVVSEACFSVKNRQRMAIVGETGSGKSVLLLAILKMLPQKAIVNGQIYFEDSELTRLSDKEMNEIRGRKIGYIPQGSGNGLNPLLTIGYQLTESIVKFRKCSKNEALCIAKELIDRFEIGDASVLHKYPFQLSGGMRQRVLIAMGIAGNAELILADEPTKGLDQHRIKLVIDAFRKLENQTLLCVTHDLRFAKAIATDIIVMYASQQIEMCTSEEFFLDPLHPYSQAMLMALPENGLEAKLGFAPPREGRCSGDTEPCHFRSRCPYSDIRCEKMPPMLTVGKRMVRCWRYADQVAGN